MNESGRGRNFRRVMVFVCCAAMFSTIANHATADELRAGTTTLVSVKADGSPADGAAPSVSSDGRYVAFESFDRLTTADTDDYQDVYRYDGVTGVIQLVSVDVALPSWIHNHSPSISGDGSKVAYASGDCFSLPTPGCYGLTALVRNMTTSTTTLVSNAMYSADAPEISRDGSWVAVVQEDEGAYWLVAVNASTGVKRGITGICTGCTGNMDPPAISASGRFLAFQSADRLVVSDLDDSFDTYWFDRDSDGNGVFDETGKTSIELVGVDLLGQSPFSRNPSISDDGSKVAYTSKPASTVVRGLGGGEVYMRDVTTGGTLLVSQNAAGVPSASLTEGMELSLTADGNQVAFSTSDVHMGIGDLNPGMDVFVRNISARTTSLLSLLDDGGQGVGDRMVPSLSADGRYVAFEASSVYQWRFNRRVYLRDRQGSCSIACVLP